MTIVPLKRVRLSERYGTAVTGHSSSGLTTETHDLRLLLEAGLVRVIARKGGETHLLSVHHFDCLIPAAPMSDEAPAPTVKK